MQLATRNYIVFAVLLTSFSCKQNVTQIKCDILTEDTVNVTCKEYDSLGKLASVYSEKDSLMHGLELLYYSNSVKKREGLWYRGIKSGWFKYYDETGKLEALRQFIPVKDRESANENASYMNQVIRFDESGDTTKKGGFFIQYYADRDTIKTGEKYIFKVVLAAPLFKEMLIILGDFDEKYELQPDGLSDTFGVDNYERSFSPLQYKTGENSIRGKVVNFENYIDSLGTSRQRHAIIYFERKFFVQA